MWNEGEDRGSQQRNFRSEKSIEKYIESGQAH